MLAKLIYCKLCKELTLQQHISIEKDEYKCICGTVNKRETKDNKEDGDETGTKEQGKSCQE